MKKISSSILLVTMFFVSHSQPQDSMSILKRGLEKIMVERDMEGRYRNDGSEIKDSLYKRILLTMDILHIIMPENKRVDSIWRFIRPRLQSISMWETDSITIHRYLHRYEPRDTFERINILPLLKGEDILLFERKKLDSIDGFYSVHANLIGINFEERLDFWDLARNIYHEAYHVFILYRGHKYSNEHKVIYELERDILEAKLFIKGARSLDEMINEILQGSSLEDKVIVRKK